MSGACVEGPAVDGAAVSPLTASASRRESLVPLLDAMPDRERRILLLRFFGGRTQTEIGQEMGISRMHVSRLLSGTLAQLRRRLQAVE